MSLTAGTRLGPYDVVAKLGEGGMGEVYRAHDSKLHRDVALKILPETLTLDLDRLARFRREAQVLASLNHPNIAAIYGFEDSGATQALVMELVEGEDLSEVIARGSVPLTEALPMARQIADALETAHEHGIVHRDLKPANIKVRPDGTVKVLDFGLAKAIDPDAASGAIQNSPTMTARATAMGMILGTAAYMAPEQARGKAVDKRADIWAFGVVLYEMLTGARAFKGEEISDTLAAVLKDTPDFAALPAALPVRLRRLIERCLERDVKLRLRDIGEARVELAKIAEGRPEPLAPVAVPAAPSRTSMLPWAVAIVALGAAGYFGWRTFSNPSSLASLSPSLHARFALDPAEALLGSNSTEIRVGSRRPSHTAIAFSRDGRWLAFVGEQAGAQQLFLRDIRRDAASAIPGTAGADNPFFSPDDKWIGFWSNGAMRKVPVDGGPAVEICKTDRIAGADWSADGKIAFGTSGPLQWVSADGGQPTALTKIDPATHEGSHYLPQWLPGGRIMYTAHLRRTPTGRRLVVQQTDGGGRQVLAENATDGRLVAGGRYLVFMRGSTLMAARFDVSRAALIGGAVGVIDGVLVSLNAPNASIDIGAGQFTVTDAGTLVYVPGRMFDDTNAVLTWMDRQGRTQPIDMDKHAYLAVRFSPDGRRAVMQTTGAERVLWLYDLGRRSLIKLPFEGEADWPIWTPDGKSIVFSGTTNEGVALYRVSADSSSKPERLPGSEQVVAPADWSHDGQDLVCDGLEGDRRVLVAFSLANKTTRVLVQSRGSVTYPAVSPDGRWLAYTSDDSGRPEVFVQPYAGGARVPVSTSGGDSARWSRDGRELVFRQALDLTRATYWSVPVAPGVSFTVGTPRRIGEALNTDFGSSTPRSNFDVGPDGRLLGTTRQYLTPPPPKILNLITNWFEELAAKLPQK